MRAVSSALNVARELEKAIEAFGKSFLLLMMAVPVLWSIPSSTQALEAHWQPTKDEQSIRGSWRARTYVLKDGTEHIVDGLIFFSDKDWMVLFFVLDHGEPKRGSGEGGRYELAGKGLTFFHRYHMSQGEALTGLSESPLRMEVRRASEAPDEPCTVEISGDELSLHFPSGNSMTFRRSSE